MTTFLYRMLDGLENRVWTIKVFVLVLPDILRLIRLYPGTWNDQRFRTGLGYALMNRGRKMNDGLIYEAGDALVSGEFVPEVE